jgi:hypothetical protein
MEQEMEMVRKTEKGSAKWQQGEAVADDGGVHREIQNDGSGMDRSCRLTPNGAKTKNGDIKFLRYLREVFVSVIIPVIVGTFMYLTLNAIIQALLR